MRVFLDWLFEHTGFVTLITIEIMMAYIVICVETLPDNLRHISRIKMLRRGIFWMLTIPSWFIHEKVEERNRLVLYTWATLTTGWLWRWVYDQIEKQDWQYADQIYLITIGTLMGFITFCIEIMPNKTRPSRARLFFRIIFWMLTIPRWFKKGDDRIVIEYTLLIWAIVVAGWLVGIINDIVRQMLGILERLLV